MGYALAVSFSRAVLAMLLTAIGGLALATAIESRFGALPALPVAVVFVSACWRGWRADRQRQPFAIRLMGGRDAILYFRGRAPGNATRRARRGPVFPVRSTAPVISIAVRIDRVVHWPGRFIGIAATPQRPPGRPFSVVILADSLPNARFRALAAQLRCVQRGVTLLEHH